MKALSLTGEEIDFLRCAVNDQIQYLEDAIESAEKPMDRLDKMLGEYSSEYKSELALMRALKAKLG